MTTAQTLALGAFVFALAVFVGFLLISKVPTMLHTPLMSGTNFIHGIVLVGALTVAAAAHDTVSDVIAVAAVLLGTLNVVGGWVVTDRMLEMFKRRPAKGQQAPVEKAAAKDGPA
ncbi:MAG: NAD(P) transhydrogenase subunit alpha [Candidatus Dormibacteraeota bacterium]|nr:NAD(P) transhydrogenase subunit alpha [Candidatus Dormibacteraeota bacterium]MBV8444855.1 NAD(P) transhydrogenase subunit alpha [Candidatus Dormibacteraeota bacterium]